MKSSWCMRVKTCSFSRCAQSYVPTVSVITIFFFLSLCENCTLTVLLMTSHHRNWEEEKGKRGWGWRWTDMEWQRDERLSRVTGQAWASENISHRWLFERDPFFTSQCPLTILVYSHSWRVGDKVVFFCLWSEHFWFQCKTRLGFYDDKLPKKKKKQQKDDFSRCPNLKSFKQQSSFCHWDLLQL